MQIAEQYMQRCLDLAVKGLGSVAPNPMVGCVIVHNDQIIGEGYHQKYGEAHAEVNAINSVTERSLLPQSTLYVNLEPCSHYGKTPPCTDLILQHNIPHVVIGTSDNNLLVNGKGIEKLTKGGCKVEVGILADKCIQLNKRFFTFHSKKRPYIILKWARTEDGFIDKKRNSIQEDAPLNISSEESKILNHKWRSEEQAIMIGTNTAVLDNPQLTVRKVKGKNPIRIIVDKSLSIPVNYKLFDNNSETIVFTETEKNSRENIKYIKIDFTKNVIGQILDELFKKNIQSVIVEGGAFLINSFIKEDIWDEARIFISSLKINDGIPAPCLIEKAISENFVGQDRLRIIVREIKQQ